MIAGLLKVIGTLLSLTHNKGAGFVVEAIAAWLDRKEKTSTSALEERK